MTKVNMIDGPYRVIAQKGAYSVYQPNGTTIAKTARKDTADRCAAALNACAVLPVLKSGFSA